MMIPNSDGYKPKPYKKLGTGRKNRSVIKPNFTQRIERGKNMGVQMMYWISVNNPPKEDDFYFVYAPGYSGGSSSAKEHHKGVMFSRYKNGKWSIEHCYHKRPNCVKAWAHIVPPEKGETNEQEEAD